MVTWRWKEMDYRDDNRIEKRNLLHCCQALKASQHFYLKITESKRMNERKKICQKIKPRALIIKKESSQLTKGDYSCKT